ncbi:hypothetical protein Purlil1_13570 [Purpureocillium lilacinum]|uniref:Uncharacterized protein n=1 Tax=Purpureocillium lilacinum TaxID=33203 RepID=A0ABR0BDN9_PURLI|nr:hypothetical protein Purlil1_13570 [Purpureocillium lilacinum]
MHPLGVAKGWMLNSTHRKTTSAPKVAIADRYKDHVWREKADPQREFGISSRKAASNLQELLPSNKLTLSVEKAECIIALGLFGSPSYPEYGGTARIGAAHNPSLRGGELRTPHGNQPNASDVLAPKPAFWSQNVNPALHALNGFLHQVLYTRWFHRLPEGVTVVNDWQELVISLLEMCVLWDPFGRGRRSTTLRPGYTATLEATQPLVVFNANYVSPWRLPNIRRAPPQPVRE